ncbi:hypothetical protein HQN90_17685 [Paenibacillus alba]|uniref:hypothetical protein n=1 Tax=Paenibacillus alba TaxID=1197127 RepID=UPI0015635D33|nr:hypothetical protein [Paenibacillus alba]NQX67956.1 hypothetical protein [Paenibacillus alba]
MIKEALQYVIEAFTAETKEISGQMYSTQPLALVKKAMPNAVHLNNLTGLVDYIKANYDEQPPVLIQVASPTEVNVLSTFNRDMNRNHLIKSTALLPNIPFEKFHDVEAFNILLQSCFVANDHRDALLKVVGNIKEETVQSVGDDGISQQVTAKTGIATVAPVVVPNPVYLKPFRTFVEVTQPESAFVFRMQNGPRAALFEADGGAWKLQAILEIKRYLEHELRTEIDNGRVIIIA